MKPRLGIIGIVVTLTMIFVILTFSSGLPTQIARSTIGQRPREKNLRPVYFSKVELLVNRSELACSTGSCVLLHFPRSPQFEMTYPASKVLGTDPNPLKDGYRFSDVGNAWCEAATSHPMTFNCCTFAIGDVAGLTPFDWVRPNASEETNNLNPMHVLLSSYFDLESRYWRDPIREAKSDASIRPGDIVCFVKTQPNLEFVHAGRIFRHSSGENWMISKFGDSDILVTPLDASARVWPDYQEVRIYHRKIRSSLEIN